MKRRLSMIIAGATAAALSANPAGAAGPSFETGRVTLDGRPVRAARRLPLGIPRRSHAEGRTVRGLARRNPAPLAGDWRAITDQRTGALAYLVGRGATFAGAGANPATAERVARSVLAALAPTTEVTITDWKLTANHWDAAHQMRTVAFQQRHRDLPILDAHVSVRFKNDRLFVVAVEAHAGLEVELPGRWATDGHLRSAALETARIKTAAGPEDRYAVDRIASPVIIAVPRGHSVEGRVVRPVDVSADDPRDRWTVYVDAGTGHPVALERRARSAFGTVLFDTVDRYPLQGRRTEAAAGVEVDLGDDRIAVTDAQGGLTWSSTAAIAAIARLSGPAVRVENASGPNGLFGFSIADGETVVLSAADAPQRDAEVSAFVAATAAKSYASALAADNDWLATGQLEVNVNVDGVCDARALGRALFFFLGNGQCENSGRIADIVYHEFGHALHDSAIIDGVGLFDPALSEAVSDYLAATINDDPGMGRGFFLDDRPVRNLDPPDREFQWPDDIDADPHQTGLILAGALWDLRTRLMNDSADAGEGVRTADRLMYAAMQRARDLPSAYFEILAADDDDGDLTNGTPNTCAIQTAFAAHGLAEPPRAFAPPQIVDRRLTMARLVPRCIPVDSVDVAWRVRDDPSQQGVLPATLTASAATALLPDLAENSILEIQVRIMRSDGEIVQFPGNPADPWYELYIGESVPLFCTDFERDPFNDGWTVELRPPEGLDARGDWAWGPPAGGAAQPTGDIGAISLDPSRAFSGDAVVGTAVSGIPPDGRYADEVDQRLTSPPIDVGGFDEVRLQYRRWLSVADDGDRAAISANDQIVWQAPAGGPVFSDREWRFHDVDLAGIIDDDGQLRVTFALTSDSEGALGGWTIDDVCVVGQQPAVSGCGCHAALEPRRRPPLAGALVIAVFILFCLYGGPRRPIL